MNETLGHHWLLLRGLSREAGHWGGFITQMKAAFPEASIQTLDLPGTGLFHQESSASDIATITRMVRHRAMEQGLLKHPVTILALSLGGMVAWEWLQTYSDEINGAVLINTSFANLSRFYERLRWQSYGKFAKLTLQREVQRRELAIVQLVSNCPSQYQSIALEWKRIQDQRPVSLKNSLKQIVAAARYRPAGEKPPHPILLLNSRGDRLVAPSCSEAIHRRWEIELRTHPWAGHDLSLDDGEWMTNQLIDWIAEQSAKPI